MFGEVNGGGENEGVVAWKFEEGKEKNVGLFVKLVAWILLVDMRQNLNSPKLKFEWLIFSHQEGLCG